MYNTDMTSTAHALVAGAIASRFSDPVTASLLALVSHYVMDSVPHWDFGTNWRSRPKHKTGMFAVIETLFGISLSYLLFGQYLSLPLWALTTIMSLLPDWLETPWYIFFAHQKKQEPGAGAGITERIAYAFYKLPNIFHAKAQLPLGIATQVITVVFFLVLLA